MNTDILGILDIRTTTTVTTNATLFKRMSVLSRFTVNEVQRKIVNWQKDNAFQRWQLTYQWGRLRRLQAVSDDGHIDSLTQHSRNLNVEFWFAVWWQQKCQNGQTGYHHHWHEEGLDDKWRISLQLGGQQEHHWIGCSLDGNLRWLMFIHDSIHGISKNSGNGNYHWPKRRQICATENLLEKYVE